MRTRIAMCIFILIASCAMAETGFRKETYTNLAVPVVPEGAFVRADFGIVIDPGPQWSFERRQVSLEKSVEVANEIWLFKNSMSESKVVALFWDLPEATDSSEFVRSFVLSLYTPEKIVSGIIDGRDTIFLFEPGSEQAQARIGMAITDKNRVILFDIQPDATDLADESISSFVRSIQFTEAVPESSKYSLGDYDLEVNGEANVTSCCGYNDGGNPYPCCNAGNCTWWSHATRTCDLPDWSWGNATSWKSRAQAEGYNIGTTPSLNAITCVPAYNCGTGQYGHVEYITSVASGYGSYGVSEMGCNAWNCVRSHTYTSGSCGESFIYNNKMGPQWDFCSGSKGMMCFSTRNLSGSACASGSWLLDPAGNDPSIVSQGAMNLDTNYYKYFVVHMAANCSDGRAQMFYSVNDGLGNFSETNSISFNITHDGTWHTYAVRVTTPNWGPGNTLRRIRFDPVRSCYTSGTPIGIAWMKLSATGNMTTIGNPTVEAIDKGIKIVWNVESEDDVYGYQILRSNQKDQNYIVVSEEFIPPNQGTYEFLDQSVETDADYFYMIEAIEKTGTPVNAGPAEIHYTKARTEHLE